MIVVEFDRDVFRIVGKYDAKARALASLIAAPEDFDEIAALAGIADDFIRDAAHRIRLLPEQDRYAGPHMPIAMLPFALPSYSRFSDGTTYGVWYAGDTVKTAAAERGFHLQRWLSLTPTPPQLLQQTSVRARIHERLHDVRSGNADVPSKICDTNSYLVSQMFGKELRQNGSPGVYYSSVRAPGFQCVGLFRPATIDRIELEEPIVFHWDGATTLALQPLE